MALSGLLRAAHFPPTVAVTAVATLLAVDAALAPTGVAAVAGAVLTGQLVIGWSNDLLDAGRDRAVGRRDKPLATGEVSERAVTVGLVAAAAVCVVLSLLLGARAGLCHLALMVGSGLAYNAGLKRTAWSWAPYAVAFGSLPAVPTLAESPPLLPAWWVMAAGALLGVGAHFVNVLPDLADDAATGVRGLPHRLGGRASQRLAAAALVLAAVALLLGPAGSPQPWHWLLLACTGALALVAALGTGATPFRAVMLIAVVDVLLLTVLGRAGG